KFSATHAATASASWRLRAARYRSAAARVRSSTRATAPGPAGRGAPVRIPPLGPHGVEHLLVVGDLDDVAVGVLERADVADRVGHVARLPVQAPQLAGALRHRVHVAALGHLDADVRERLQQPLLLALVLVERD